jgi:hypothetical protein
MNNKLDSFNKDKVKCLKCKEYFDNRRYYLCEDCYRKWSDFVNLEAFLNWCNNKEIRNYSEALEYWCDNEQA